ncbi:MAG: cysteine desulfurase [Oscillospiraceae bacterium]|jgi:cysteine desulfurase|nr:cysteine desulfurase [Oscillospiraceae bacterium]
MDAYLDNSATTSPCPEAVAAMLDALQVRWGNPSSMHKKGYDGEAVREEARVKVAARLHCAPEEVHFTSGGTEANNLAIIGAAMANAKRGRRVVTSSVEHSSIAQSVAELERRGFEVVYLDVDANGRVSEEEIQAKVNADTILVSLMAVNNEVGTLQPVDTIRKAVAAVGAPAVIHCDCVQAFGKLPIYPNRLGVDMITVSSHKIHGPKGAGALYVRKGTKVKPILYGGEQEGTLRPGTEPMPAIAGFGAAAAAFPDEAKSLAHVSMVKDRLVAGLNVLEGIQINSPENALAYLTNISVPGLKSETMLNFLSERGICVSAGSACSRGKKSKVLKAMGLSEREIDGALRISLTRESSVAEVQAFLTALEEATRVLARS